MPSAVKSGPRVQPQADFELKSSFHWLEALSRIKDA
jgi:hypothetical protein